MKWLYLLAFTAITSGNILAQETARGPVYQTEKGYLSFRSLGADSSQLHYLRTQSGLLGGETFHYDRFNAKTLERTFSTQLNLPSELKDQEPETSFMLGGIPVFIQKEFSKSENMLRLLAYRIDKNGNFQTPVILASEAVQGRKAQDPFTVITNRSTEEIHVFTKSPVARNIRLARYNAELQLTDSISSTLPVDLSEVAIREIISDPTGLYVLAHITDPPKAGTHLVKYRQRFALFRYVDEDSSFVEYDLSLKNKFITELRMAEGNDGHLIVSGFYSTQPDNLHSGILYLRLRKADGKITGLAHFPLNDQLLRDFKSGAGLEHFYLRALLPVDSGKVWLVSEYARDYQVSISNPRSGIVTYAHHYENDEVLMFLIDSTGTLQLQQMLDKDQHTINDRGQWNGIEAGVKGDTLILLYNDAIKNQRVDNNKRVSMRSHSHAALVISSFTPDGRFRSGIVQRAEGKAEPVTIRTLGFSSPGNVILPVTQGSRFHLSRLSF